MLTFLTFPIYVSQATTTTSKEKKKTIFTEKKELTLKLKSKF